jgi:iron complex transport system substrate-binding protein
MKNDASRISNTPRIIMLLICCVLACSLPVFSLAASERTGATKIDVEDFRGKRLIFSKPVSRIVCLLDSALTGLYMLGAADKIIGVSATAYTGSSARYYAAMDQRIRKKALPVVSSSMAGSLERIIALKPDLVILWNPNMQTIASLEERNIPVFVVFIDSVEDIYKEVLALGELTGTGRRARELVDYTRKEISLIAKKTAGLPKNLWPRTYFMWANGELDSAGSASIVQKLLTISGAVNICEHINQEHVVISMEHLLVSDPQVIIMWYNGLLDPSDILKKPVWRSLTSARNGRIYEMPDLFTCDLCTLNFQYAVKLLARWCHPELFGGKDLEREAERTFVMLYGPRLPKGLIADSLRKARGRP